MMFSMKIAAVLALFLPTPVIGACDNNESYTVSYGGKNLTCSKLRMPANSAAREALCATSATLAACPHSCGTCCEDAGASAYTFVQKNGAKSQPCTWILKGNPSKDATRTLAYCNGYWSNGSAVRAKCQVSCDFCFDPVTGTTPAPTSAPTAAPTPAPTPSPVPDDGSPSAQPTRPPSPQPSPFPTLRPSTTPSDSPSLLPSFDPSDSPSKVPSDSPSQQPSTEPSDSPSQQPSTDPSDQPSKMPSDSPSQQPSTEPSDQPSLQPSTDPSSVPSKMPSDSPSMVPSSDPSQEPTMNPTESIKPSARPSVPTGPTATPAPTASPTATPTAAPTPAPNACSDGVGTFTLDNSNTQTCPWFTSNASKTQVRKDKYCGRAELVSLCPSTCGYCTCSDDASYEWDLIEGINKGSCEWLTKNSVKAAARKAKYCTEAFELGVVSFRCAAACGTGTC